MCIRDRLELGFQQLRCLNIAVTGTNGKTPAAGLIEQVLLGAQRETRLAGKVENPVCDAVDGSKELDYLILAVNSFQLELTQLFSPTVAVVTNLSPDHMDHYGNMESYVKAKARIFANQQPFDWAIIQSEALAHIRSFGIEIPSKIITFSASNRRAWWLVGVAASAASNSGCSLKRCCTHRYSVASRAGGSPKSARVSGSACSTWAGS